MTRVHDESLTRAAFAAARALEPTDAEVAAVLARAGLEPRLVPAGEPLPAPVPRPAGQPHRASAAPTRRAAPAGARPTTSATRATRSSRASSHRRARTSSSPPAARTAAG